MRVPAEIVLDLLKGGKHRLSVVGDIGVIGRRVLMELGAVEAAIKDGLRDRRTDGPEAARPVEPVRETWKLSNPPEAESVTSGKNAP